MSFNLDHGNRMPDIPGVPYGWQATADNSVTRHYTSTTAADLGLIGKYRIKGLRNRLVGASAAIDNILKGLDEMDAVMAGAPSEELATAQQALINLQKRNDNLIKQCRMWKARTEEAKRTAERHEAALQRANNTVVEKLEDAAPGDVFILRRRTPGDSVRYLAAEVMKHAEDNIELAGVAMALRMIAADVDNLPQGTA